MVLDKRCYKNNTRWFNVKAVYYRVLNCSFERDLAMEILEVASKPQVRFKSKAQADEKAQSARVRWLDEQYILRRFATQLLGLRWGFEITSNHLRWAGK